MENKSGISLAEAPIGKLMARYEIPCIISLLVASLYNIVDQLFIANASYLGSYGNAANNVVFPMTIVALSIAVMIGDGCCAFVSICLGSGRTEDSHKSVGSAIVICIISSIIITALYYIFMDSIITFFGGRINEETYRNAWEYFTWISAGIPFYMFGQCLNPIIRSDGSPAFAMASTLAGAVFNIIFDPILIYVMHWGMMGAAVATIAGQIVTAVLAIWYLFHMKSVKLTKKSFRIHVSLAAKYLPLGITSFLSQISIVASMAAVNRMIVQYGAMDEIFGLTEYSQIPLAVLGIVMKFFQVVISIAVGLAAGCIPIIGYNVGAGKWNRVREIFKRLLIFEFLCGFVALLIVEILPVQIMMLFGASNESEYYLDFGIKTFRIYLCMLPLSTVNKGTFISLQSLGKAAVSSLLSLLREVVFGVGFPVLLPLFFGLTGVLYSMPAADLITFIIAAWYIAKIFRKLGENETAALKA